MLTHPVTLYWHQADHLCFVVPPLSWVPCKQGSLPLLMSLVWPGPSTNRESNPENHLVSARSPLASPFMTSRGYWGPIRHQEAPSWAHTTDNHRAYMNGLVWSLLSTCSTFLLCSIVANSTPHFQVLVTNGETVPLGCHAVCYLLLYVNMDPTTLTWSPPPMSVWGVLLLLLSWSAGPWSPSLSLAVWKSWKSGIWGFSDISYMHCDDLSQLGPTKISILYCLMLTSPLSRSPYQLLMLSRDPISTTFHQDNLIKYQMPSEQGTICCLFDDSASHLDHESFQSLLVFRWQVITYPFLDGWGCLYLHRLCSPHQYLCLAMFWLWPLWLGLPVAHCPAHASTGS